MPKFKIPVIYQMYGTYHVEADSVEDAVRHVLEWPNVGLPPTADYLDDSMEIDTDSPIFGNEVA